MEKKSDQSADNKKKKYTKPRLKKYGNLRMVTTLS